jgi:hypothetical protein
MNLHRFRPRAAAGGLALVAVLVANAAHGEAIGTLRVDYSNLQTSDYDGNDFVIHDAVTNYDWKFASGDRTFYLLLQQLNGVSPHNVAQVAYVGNPPADQMVSDHAAWVAPLTADGRPSVYAAGPIKNVKSFDPQALRISMSEATRSYVLTDGKVTVADVPRGDDKASLELLQGMIQKYGLNAAWQMTPQFEIDKTPFGSTGPVVVFLRMDGAHNTVMTASASTKSDGKASCKGRWWNPMCW